MSVLERVKLDTVDLFTRYFSSLYTPAVQSWHILCIEQWHERCTKTSDPKHWNVGNRNTRGSRTKSNVYSIIPSPLQSWIMKWMHLTSVTNLIKFQNMWGHKQTFMELTQYIYLKGQCHEIFCFRFFSWIIFPQAPKKNIRFTFRNLSKIRGDIGNSRCTTGINDIGGNLPPVSNKGHRR